MQITSIAEEENRHKTRKVSRYGSRAKVWHGGAEMTSGGLRKDDLEKNRYGRIVSKKRSQTMKNRLFKE